MQWLCKWFRFLHTHNNHTTRIDVIASVYLYTIHLYYHYFACCSRDFSYSYDLLHANIYLHEREMAKATAAKKKKKKKKKDDCACALYTCMHCVICIQIYLCVKRVKSNVKELFKAFMEISVRVK